MPGVHGRTAAGAAPLRCDGQQRWPKVLRRRRLSAALLLRDLNRAIGRQLLTIKFGQRSPIDIDDRLLQRVGDTTLVSMQCIVDAHSGSAQKVGSGPDALIQLSDIAAL